MNYREPQLRRMLAAEYVLGTLQGRARMRFDRLLRADAALLGEVHAWERKLAPLALAITPVPPRGIVWSGIERRINAMNTPTLPPRKLPSINFWRTWSAVATAAALLLAVALQQQMQFSMQIVVMPKIVHEAPLMPYVAVLKPDKSDARWVVSMYPEKKTMKVAASGSYPVDAQHALELWALEKSGPRPLGLLPLQGQAEMALPAAMQVEGELTLAVSVEPTGGSPTGLPTGPVILSAPASRAI
ncbi:MAG TPA: anti-sigma factor [Nevskiaceae bacterium]|nr:anti-sigma factor [Nevskiaceae bacterium]